MIKPKLFLFGGGDIPSRAALHIKSFMLENDSSLKILVMIPWASSRTNEDLFNELISDLNPSGEYVIRTAPRYDDIPTSKKALFELFDECNGIFFCGGDQNLIAEVLRENKDIRDKLKDMYFCGILFAGTSAGCAVMSNTMITVDEYYQLLYRGLKPPQLISFVGRRPV
jgi:cyanophycinase-like exopeptidase